MLLLVASYFFYAAWNPPFVSLLVLSTVLDWFVARRINASVVGFERKFWLGISLLVNLGLLVFFKYSGFLLENFANFMNMLGVAYSPARFDIILPMGISFYTFQTLSYSIDVYRRKQSPCDSFLDYALYVTFFPQLVAGPIVRSDEFLPQCRDAKKLDLNMLGLGLVLMIVGMFQKVVVADALLAPAVDRVFGAMESPNFIAAWCGTLAFTGQIFCDFSGYSTCAIGAAMCLGFVLPRNFHAPYAAVGFSDFWQRWHISLSSWLRDYLYIPLGGNRSGTWGTYRNLMLTMLIGGLWHGASWTFVAWGGLHGLFLIGERLIRHSMSGWSALLGTGISRLGLQFVTLFLVCITWVFFRAESFSQANLLLSSMFSPFATGDSLDRRSVAIVLMAFAAILFGHQWTRTTPLENRLARMPAWACVAMVGGMLYSTLTMPGQDRAFIYFQF
ncbi:MULTISPECIES: MBOAT family O-acyltransferase [Rhodopirellula]|uniref:MBOAT family O-acyltransferase n=1 Tax=Rhodopirellula TaxID=265488 RepID=UPI00257AD95F|nr:MBOAT family O-acyltransferase [Rhodopirellula sp. UBA1907]